MSQLQWRYTLPLHYVNMENYYHAVSKLNQQIDIDYVVVNLDILMLLLIALIALAIYFVINYVQSKSTIMLQHVTVLSIFLLR